MNKFFNFSDWTIGEILTDIGSAATAAVFVGDKFWSIFKNSDTPILRKLLLLIVVFLIVFALVFAGVFLLITWLKKAKTPSVETINHMDQKADGEGHKDIYIASRLTETKPTQPSKKGRSKPWREIDAFFLDEVFPVKYTGKYKYCCILADAGMGKTTALEHLYKAHKAKHAKSKYDIYLLNFCDKDVLDKIEKIENKNRSILLLDALDENLDAQDINKYPNFRQRLINSNAFFARVIITCRPSFFDHGRQGFGETSIKHGNKHVTYQTLYLDYFDNSQVDKYIEQAYPLWNVKTRNKAKSIVEKCSDITIRPLMLSYIDLLVEENKSYNTTREIYDVIINRHNGREVDKSIPQNREKSKVMWQEIFSIVAHHIYKRGLTGIQKDELEKIVAEYNIVHNNGPQVDITIFQERSSLLVPYSDGDEYRFSHKSFYEYLMAYRFFLDWHEIGSLQGMDFAVQIFNELVEAWQQDKEGFAIGGQTFSEAHVANSLHQMGYYLQSLNNFKEAEKDYQAALEIRRRLGTAHEPNLAATLNNLANIHKNMNNDKMAAKEYEEALKIRRKLAQGNSAFESYVAETLNNLAIFHCKVKKYKNAENEFIEALKIVRKLAKDNTNVYKPRVADTLNNLAVLHYNTKKYNKVEIELEEALKIRSELAQDEPCTYEPNVAGTLLNLCELHRKMEDYNKAAKEYEKVLKISRELAINNPDTYEPKVAQALFNIAVLYEESQVDLSKAEEYAKESHDLFQKLAKRCHEAFDKDVENAEGLLARIRKKMKNSNSPEK